MPFQIINNCSSILLLILLVGLIVYHSPLYAKIKKRNDVKEQEEEYFSVDYDTPYNGDLSLNTRKVSVIPANALVDNQPPLPQQLPEPEQSPILEPFPKQKSDILLPGQQPLSQPTIAIPITEEQFNRMKDSKGNIDIRKDPELMNMMLKMALNADQAQDQKKIIT